ncbi:PRC-barrel domain containing protein [Halobacteriaceae archaeon GCM10025711]
MVVTFTGDDEGKTVVNKDGDEIGVIKEVRTGTAYVDPDPNLLDTIRSKLSWDQTGGGRIRWRPTASNP